MTAPPDPVGSCGPEPVPDPAREMFGPELPRATRYVTLLATRGVERGLIGPREASRLWSRHVLNSAALAGHVQRGAAVVDVGSGAGLPGIPLKLARPDLRVRLVEPMARRVAFLHEVVEDLNLDVEVIRARAEELPPSSADAVVARAVAPLRRLVPLAMPLLRPHGRLLALKGANAAAEIADATSVLRRWPSARTRTDRVAYGAEATTVVIIDLDDPPPNSRGFVR